MHACQIFKNPEKGLQAVKRGFSWPAFFLGFIWALSRRMWLAAALLMVCTIALGFLMRALGWHDYLFSLAVALLVQGIVGSRANFWRSNHLQNIGYALIGTINARNPHDAVAKVAASGGTIPAGMKAAPRAPGFLSVPKKFRGVFAIVTLTWKAAFRYKLFWVIAALLLGAVVGLPILVKGDGTASGFAQVLITYTLGSITGLLGLCTLWLACGTLARDVEECQIQMVVVKPIARWQVWLGKWLGLVTLNAALLALAGACIYGLLEWRARSLPPDEFARLQSEVLIARDSFKEDSFDDAIGQETDRRFHALQDAGKLQGLDARAVRAQLESQVKTSIQVVPPGGVRPWLIHLGSVKDLVKNQPLYLRIKFNTAQVASPATYAAAWQVGNPDEHIVPWQDVMSQSPDNFHEFAIPPNLFDDRGNLLIQFGNLNDTALLFPLEDGLEVLYRSGGFGLNFVRGLAIILCWMALLAALGLAAASFLSFPAAAFTSLALLVMGLSSGTLSTVVTQGTIMGWDSEASTYGHSPLDYFVVPAFRAALKIINLVQQFSPIDSLTTGRNISWSELGQAFVQIILLLGGILGVFGIFVFHRRELATAQATH